MPPSVSAGFFENLLIGHRGCNLSKNIYRTKPIGVPENSLKAIQYALEHGVDGVELDITLSKDGVPIIMHDDTTSRMCETTNHKLSEHVKECTFEELQMLKYKNDTFEQKIPTLRECLDLTQKTGNFAKTLVLEPTDNSKEMLRWKPKLMLEVKPCHDYKHMAKQLVQAFQEYDLFETAVVGSFLPVVLYHVRALDPRIVTLLLVEEEASCLTCFGFTPSTPFCSFLLDRVLSWSLSSWLPSFLGVGVIGFDHRLLSKTPEKSRWLSSFDVDKWKARGYSLNCWTVNIEADKKSLLEKRISVTTDFLFPLE